MNIELVLSDLVDAAERTIRLDNAMVQAGYDGNPYFTIYGYLADAIYHIIGEKTETFEESSTSCILIDPNKNHDERVQLLLNIYKTNNPPT